MAKLVVNFNESGHNLSLQLKFKTMKTKKLQNQVSLFLLIALLCTKASLAQAPTVPTPDHIVVVIMENHSSTEIIGSGSAPYINQLANGGALFTQSFGVTHPSQPNYLMLFSGSQQGVVDDNMPSNLPFLTPNLGAALIAKGLSFTTYSESLPSIGFTGALSGSYARKHNPAANWQGTSANGIPSNLNQPLTNFPTNNYALLPKVCFVIPNLLNDMHDGTVNTGDVWLKNNLDAYAQWAKVNNSLLIVTFDEDDYTLSNQITTIFYGGPVKTGKYSEHIDHYKVLRTIEDMYALPYAGASASSSPITDCWNISIPNVPNNTFVDFDARDLSFNGFGGSTFNKLLNPSKLGIDSSANVGQVVKANASQTWAGVTSVQLGSKIDFSSSAIITLKSFSPKICTVLLKLEDFNNSATSIEIQAITTSINSWEELSFNFSGAASGTYDKISVFFDFGGTTGDTYYFDEIKLNTDISTGSINLQELNHEISLYPNPISNVLNIKSNKEIDEVSIYNYEGREIEKIKTSSNMLTINTASLNSGIYFLKVKSNGISTVKRFIKE
jgi:hypothetical protein